MPCCGRVRTSCNSLLYCPCYWHWGFFTSGFLELVQLQTLPLEDFHDIWKHCIFVEKEVGPFSEEKSAAGDIRKAVGETSI